MNFNDPKVKLRVMSHINFAIRAVNATFTEIIPEKPPLEDTETQLLRQISEQLRNPIIMQVLAFTLNLDYQLKNTLTGTDKGL